MTLLGTLLPRLLESAPPGAKRAAAAALGGLLRAGGLTFRCNLCGRRCPCGAGLLYREEPSCPGCGSSVRLRAVVSVLSRELFAQSLCLAEFPRRKDLVGLGLSDWDGYAAGLAAAFDYRNTFYHREPRLDISDPPADLAGTLDFLVASDVFEHVPPPVARAFAGAFRLLKPGGLLVLTVPYRADRETVEHFPELFRWAFDRRGEGTVLRNQTRDGRAQVFTDLRFHGGPGQILEMRAFGGESLFRDLRAAGFERVRAHGRPVLRHGVFWWHANSLPVTARRPGGRAS